MTIVDPRDYHLFTPLLYQVASCLLSPSEVAAPIRKVFRGVPNVRYRQDQVVALDHDARRATLASGTVLEYDACVLATGSATNYYGNASVEEHALGLKDLSEALQLRNHVLTCFEQATATDDDAERRRLLTFCVVGAGPTGVEYAGALAEFVRLVVPNEYPELASTRVQILLLEGGDRVLAPFKPRLSAYTARQLARLGVEVRTRTLVTSADDAGVVLARRDRAPDRDDGVDRRGTTARARSTLLTSDPTRVRSGASRSTTTSASRGPRARTRSATSPPAPAGAGRCCRCSRRPRCRPAASSPPRSSARAVGPFRYRDKGMLATIGRRAAVGPDRAR